MSFALPTVLTLSRKHRPVRERAAEDCVADVPPVLQARLVEGLLGDALLTCDDLPGAWRPVDTGVDSLLAGTSYPALMLASLPVAFAEERSGALVRQEVAVLPRWALRHLAAGQDAAPARVPVGESEAVAMRPAGGQAVTDVAAASAADGRLLVRRGTVVMALRFEGAIAPGAAAAIRAAAIALCEHNGVILQ
ncbi:MAG: hypothetical protein IVW36_12295 [Dehalococcoidia bacterium]|nr:hypothetical protein [Dehalococcoidia bacterium]